MKRKDLIAGMTVAIFHPFGIERQMQPVSVVSPHPYRQVSGGESGSRFIRTNGGPGVLCMTSDGTQRVFRLNQLYPEGAAVGIVETRKLLGMDT